jgi:hypothetical protein
MKLDPVACHSFIADPYADSIRKEVRIETERCVGSCRSSMKERAVFATTTSRNLNPFNPREQFLC